MERKIAGIFVLMLFIATAVLPVVGTMNEEIYQNKPILSEPVVEWEKTFG